MSTLVCVPIMVQDEPTALADAAVARDSGADIVEYRIDEFFSGMVDSAGNLDAREVGTIERLIAQCPLPCIVTCRSSSEGGHYDGDDMARVSLYERLGTSERPPQYLDIEFAAYTRSANLRQKVNLAVDHPRQQRDVRTGLVLSAHDFSGRPADLLRRIASMQEQPAARIVKIAYHARSIRDNLEIFDLLAENAGGRPMIALAMGQFGLMSRVLAPKFGGFLTFASLHKQSTTAPGQPTVRELLDLYNFRSINPRTRVLGVIGWPVEHSISPAIHNAGFEALAPDTWERAGASHSVPHDGVYLPMPVPPEYEHFNATLSALIDHPALDFAGCSVTLPHKQHLVRFARERIATGDGIAWDIDPLSSACGAANTLVVDRDSLGNPIACRVRNTDASAAAGVLSEALSGSFDGRRIVLIGAGGVARAIAAGLLARGANVVVASRTREKPDELARDLAKVSLSESAAVHGTIVAEDLADVLKHPCDALVNCTPLGMKGGPSPKQSPVDVHALRQASPNAVVFDTVYNPLITPLLEQASLAGLRTIDGLEMFVRQAGEQFALWTGHAPPISLYRRVAREILGVS